MQNMKSIINKQNMNILNNVAEIKKSCNCRSKNNCPLDGKCLTLNIIYEAKITRNQPTYKEKIYNGTAKTDFKYRLNNHMKSFNLQQYENDTDPSIKYWIITRSQVT